MSKKKTVAQAMLDLMNSVDMQEMQKLSDHWAKREEQAFEIMRTLEDCGSYDLESTSRMMYMNLTIISRAIMMYAQTYSAFYLRAEAGFAEATAKGATEH